MKIKSKSKKSLIISLLVATLIGIALAVSVYSFSMSGSNNETSMPNTDNTQKSDLDSKNTPDSPEDKEKPTNTDQPAAPASDSSSQKERVQMVVSVNISDGVLYIRGGANYPMLSEGTCYANLIGPSGQVIQKNTTLLQNPSSTDCKTISVPVSELTAGNWTASLHYSSPKYEGDSSDAAFSIN